VEETSNNARFPQKWVSRTLFKATNSDHSELDLPFAPCFVNLIYFARDVLENVIPRSTLLVYENMRLRTIIT